MLNLREFREKSPRLPEKLPWACIIAPGVVLQKDALLQKTIAFRGADLDSSSGSEIVGVLKQLNDALLRLGSGWALFFEAQRFEIDAYPSSEWTNPLAWLVDHERRQTARRAGAQFESSYFLTFVWQMPSRAEKKVEAFFFDSPAEGADISDNERDLQHFQRTVIEMVDLLRGVFLDVGELDDEQTLTYLHSTVSTNRHPVRVPEAPMYLDALLPDMPFTAGEVPMLGSSFIPTCSVNGFPAELVPGLLDALNSLDLEYRWVTRFICLDREAAAKEISAYRKSWWQQRKSLWTTFKEAATKEESQLVDPSAEEAADDATMALSDLNAGRVGFGYLSTTVTVMDEDLESARRKIRLVKRVIQSRGFTVIEESHNAREAWLGSLPGHVYSNVRRPLLSTANLASLIPLNATWTGDEVNAHLREVTGCGTPHLLCSSGSSPFRLNLAVGDLGHTFVGGPPGAGKSTLLILLALQWLRYWGSQVVIFDKDRTARAATLAVNGAYYEPGNAEAKLSFQPLAAIDSPADRAWAGRFVATMLEAQGIDVDSTVKSSIDGALTNLAQNPLRQRTITNLVSLLGSHSKHLGAALRPYTVEGSYGHIFDGEEDSLRTDTWTMFEMGHLMEMGEEVVIPALEYLFRRVEHRFDGRATLLLLDEVWRFLKHPVFAARLRDWLKTLRKKNVYVVFSTQEIADVAGTPELFSTVNASCPTKIFLPNPEATTPAMAAGYREFGLSDVELATIAGAAKKRDYYYRSSKGRRLFQLQLDDVALALVRTASPEDHRFLDTISGEHVRTPTAMAEAILSHQKLPWAAKVLRDAVASGRRLIS